MREDATVKRAIGYARVSTQGQADRGMGLRAQVARIRELARDERLELAEIVQEAASAAVREGELTSLEHRPELNTLLRRAERGDFATLIVASFDRLSRDQLDAQLIKRWFGKYGVACVSAAGEANGAEGPLAELIDRILGAIHDFDRKRILERVRAGKDERRRQGRHVGGPVPFGYRVAAASEGGKILEAIEELRPIVLRIFRDAARGLSPGRIAQALNDEKVRGPTHGEWQRQTVRNVIENRAYRGELHGMANAHEAIVSPRLWNAANRALKSRARAK
jgi:site-specific DNA recombinase